MIRHVVAILFGVVVLLAAESICSAEPIRLLVAVGHRSGLVGEAPLKHATRDATKVRDLFTKLGGVRSEHALLLEEPTPSDLYAAIDRLAALAKNRPRADVSLIFYFSGHGDREAIHLGATRVPLRDIDTKLASVSAGLRILVTDACRTADVRGKGVSAEAPFAISVDAKDSASGVVRVHASADGEIAQESDELGGAVFTHYWITGLSGGADVNGDGRVTFAEAYSFAYSQTLFRSARASGVVQRPDVQSDLVEGAPIVLTRTSNTSAIKLPRGADAHYVVYGVGSRTIVGELWEPAERVISLAIPPGKYIVQRRAGGRSAATQIDLAKDEQRELNPSDFQLVAEETLARKGGELVLHPSELSLGYFARTGSVESVGHELILRYRHGWDGLALGLGAFGGFGSMSRPGQESTVVRIGADALVELRRHFGPAVMRLGGGPRVVGLIQTIARDDADRLILAGYPTDRRYRGLAIGGHLVVGGRAPLGSRAFIDIDAHADLLGARVSGFITPLRSVGVGTAVGFAF